MGADQGTIKYKNAVFIGGVKESKPHSQGKVKYNDGTTIEGQFNDGKFTNGKIICKSYEYTG